MSLESVLRIFFVNSVRDKNEFKFDDEVEVGTEIKINAFTSTESLSEWIVRYNRNTEVTSKNMQIDSSLAVVRNALAHGRMLSSTGKPYSYRLLNYSHNGAKKGCVKVQYNVEVTENWLRKNIDKFYQAVQKVHEVTEQFYPMDV
jgi:hypothetical protein